MHVLHKSLLVSKCEVPDTGINCSGIWVFSCHISDVYYEMLGHAIA